jgi:murein DD-endopeptidase MepM/ murein hydrolase activator NlpD
MRSAGTFILGFAAGVLALAVLLTGTGRLLLSPPVHAALSGPDARHVLPADAPAPMDTHPSTALNISLPLSNLKRADIQDTFNDARGGGTKHEATDILAPRGAPVLAVDEGSVVKLFTSKKGGLTVYQFDRSRTYCYYYAHLDGYAEGLAEGMLVHRGDRLGYVGTTGDAPANTPHLHFAILQLGPDKHWWEHTTALDPYPFLVKALP